jgi:hypothetical protein
LSFWEVSESRYIRIYQDESRGTRKNLGIIRVPAEIRNEAFQDRERFLFEADYSAGRSLELSQSLAVKYGRV